MTFREHDYQETREESDYNFNHNNSMINPQTKGKVKKSIHFPVMESFDLNLMATDDPSNCGSV